MFDSIVAFAHAHPFALLGIYFVFASAIGAMPTPQSHTGFYRWSFDFLHVLASGAARVVATRYPGMLGNGNGNGQTPMPPLPPQGGSQ